MKTISQLMEQMIVFSNGNLHDITHFITVWTYAKTIGELEGLDADTQYLLEATAIVHDIACPFCREKYGRADGKLQEKEGPALAEQMLSELGFEKDVIERVSFLVGHHHTYTGIDGLDYQILVEADFLVNLFEGNTDTAHIRTTYDNIFRTETGKKICREMFGL